MRRRRLKKLGKHRGQVEKAREHLRVEEENMQGLERELVAGGRGQGSSGQAQSVRNGGEFG